MNFINVKNLHFAILENEEPLTYTDFERLAPAVSIGISTETSSAEYEADGQVQEAVNQLSKLSVAIQCQAIGLEKTAKLLGHKYDRENNSLVQNAGDKAPYVALAYARERADGSMRYVKLWKVKFAIPSEEAKTGGSSTEFQDMTIEGTGLPLVNGDYKYNIEPNGSNSAEIEALFVNPVYNG